MTIYEAACKPSQPTWRQIAGIAWTMGGLAVLVSLAWAEPFSAKLWVWAASRGWSSWWIQGVGMPAVMILRGILAVEAVGYIYHRFFQHLGWLTRRSGVIRRNQMYHWAHHMIIYPIGRFYQRAITYVPSEPGIAWSWAVPVFIAVGVALASMGFKWQTLIFIASLGIYAAILVDTTHSRFHEVKHPWTNSRYFHWLEDIHVLHHWDQRCNFTIVHPLMDVLFGTYLSPAAHKREIKTALNDEDLTVSDLTNWRYLLLEASPAEYAAFISQAHRHPRSLRKMGKLLDLLRARLKDCPSDAQARELELRASGLMAAVSAPRPAAV